MCECKCDKCGSEWKEIEVITDINVVNGQTTITKEKLKVMVNNEIGFATGETFFKVSNETLGG